MLVDVVFLLFFFFKQKTAYEMRISDWSSDVCSSDLGQIEPRFRHHLCRGTAPLCGVALRLCAPVPRNDAEARRRAYRRPVAGDQHRAEDRSEEHTSELQSLMRISYAVFCLQKKKINIPQNK